MVKKIFYTLTIVISTVLLNFACTSSFSQNEPLTTGIYYGNIGKDQLILVVDHQEDSLFSGFYIHNRKNAVEKKIPFILFNNDKQWIIKSEEFNGIFKGKLDTINHFRGNLSLIDNKRVLFFWKNHSKVDLTKRPERTAPLISRYKNKTFSKINVQSDILYGRAPGYWTETPYLDDPYIEILGKGMVNFFKAVTLLDLRLDLYQPNGDSLNLRPLILLIHGGGFYIGNKQSVTEHILANAFAERGYVVASMDYRMGFKLNATSIERGAYRTLQDVDAALRHLSHNATEYGIDPSQVYVAGTSAGAIAALNIAFMSNDERPEKSYEHRTRDDLGPIESSGNNYTNRFVVKAIGNLWGAVSDTAVIDADEQIPVISFHGTADNIVPYGHDFPFKNTLRFNRLLMTELYGSSIIKERLDHLHIENKLIPFENKGHEPQLNNFKTINSLMDTIKNELVDFFYKQTIAKVNLESENCTINASAIIAPLNLTISNGELIQIEIDGGLQITDDPMETSIIWFADESVHKAEIYTTNRFLAIAKKSIAINFIE